MRSYFIALFSSIEQPPGASNLDLTLLFLGSIVLNNAIIFHFWQNALRRHPQHLIQLLCDRLPEFINQARDEGDNVNAILLRHRR